MLFARFPFQTRDGARFSFLRPLVVFFFCIAWTTQAGNFYQGTSPSNVPWTNGVVPFEFTNSLTPAETNAYMNGLREWQLAASVTFVPHTNQTHWILFTYNTNWIDNVSPGTNPQVVTVSSLSRAQVCHEMGHSFGFTHENIRRDATNFIAVLTNNIYGESSNIFFFTIDPNSVTNGNYDYESVMHLGWNFESTNPATPTQQPKPPNFPRYQFRMGNFCLSPGDRAALAYLYGPPTVPLTNIVTTTADFGPGSLRAAIYFATDHPGTTIRFNIPMSDAGYSNGVFNIHLTGMLPPLVADGTVIDGSTQPGFTGKPLIVVDASQIIPETLTSDTFLIYSANNQVKNISFTGFDWNGVTLLYADATNNVISGCWIGVDATGTNAAPNAYQGILIASGASQNIIGPGNVISGNTQYGVFITDSNTTGNVVLGNFIGTTASGSSALANGKSGVIIGGGAHGNVIGSTNAAGRNVLSGNTEYGLFLTNTTGNVVEGNLIGLGASGTNGLGNGIGFGGVFFDNDATGNLIGGTAAGAGNIVSGNDPAGIFLGGANASGNLIEGNYIGTDITGTNAIGNALAGVYLPFGTPGNVIGGTTPGARNVISGNGSYGIYFNSPATSSNVVQGNYIGVTPDGKHAVGNVFAGVIIFGGATNNLIGGTSAGAGNVISGFFGYGIYLSDAGTAGNVIQGNLIGVDCTGTNALGNGYANILLQLGTTNNVIGGTAAGAGNVIAFSGGPGLMLLNPGTTNNSIRGNSIFSNGYLGINFSNTSVALNHSGFLAGPNNMQNFPVITNAIGTGFSTIVRGTLNSLASRSYFIDVYRNPAADGSGYGQGQFYLGTVSVTADGSGNASFALTNNSGNFTGQYFSATATDPAGNTSEFGADVMATNVPGAAAQLAAPLIWRTNGFIFSLNLVTNFGYHIQTTTNLANPLAWVNLTNFTATNISLNFTDRTATNSLTRFYRVTSP